MTIKDIFNVCMWEVKVVKFAVLNARYVDYFLGCYTLMSAEEGDYKGPN